MGNKYKKVSDLKIYNNINFQIFHSLTSKIYISCYLMVEELISKGFRPLETLFILLLSASESALFNSPL